MLAFTFESSHTEFTSYCHRSIEILVVVDMKYNDDFPGFQRVISGYMFARHFNRAPAFCVSQS